MQISANWTINDINSDKKKDENENENENYKTMSSANQIELLIKTNNKKVMIWK